VKVDSTDDEMFKLDVDDGKTDVELVGIETDELEKGEITPLLAVEDSVSE
jgi:hypothetical protein